MIPQGIASTGAYADLWSHLKSMAHALDRVRKATTPKDITNLDKARLVAFTEFLKRELESEPVVEGANAGAFLSYTPESTYALEADLRDLLQELPSFKDWLKAQKLGLKEKSGKLIASLESYTSLISANDSLLPQDPPQAEFTVLRDLLAKLLLQTESALVV